MKRSKSKEKSNDVEAKFYIITKTRNNKRKT